MCEKDYNARWRVQMCRFSVYNVSMTLESYRPGLHSHNNALYHVQIPTHTCFLAQMSHIGSSTTTISSLITSEKHAGIVDHWPWVWGVLVYVCACVNLTLALWADWLFIPWCIFGLCSHSYCIYGCVSAYLTNHTHSHSLCLCMLSPHYHLTYKTQPCYSFTVISLSLRLISKRKLSQNPWSTICVCLGMSEAPELWQPCETARAEHQQALILWCIFSSAALVFPPFLLFWSLHIEAEGRGEGHRKVCVYGGRG